MSSPGPRHSCQELLGFSSCCSAHGQIVSGKDFGQAAFLEEASASGYLIRPGSGEDCHKQTELGPKLGAGILCSQLTSTSKEHPARQVGAPACVGLGHWWREEARGRCSLNNFCFPSSNVPPTTDRQQDHQQHSAWGRRFQGHSEQNHSARYVLLLELRYCQTLLLSCHIELGPSYVVSLMQNSWWLHTEGSPCCPKLQPERWQLRMTC